MKEFPLSKYRFEKFTPKTSIFVFLLMAITSIHLYSRDNTANTKVNYFIVRNMTYDQTNKCGQIAIQNNSTQNVIIVFEKDNMLSSKQIFRKNFKRRNAYGFSLIEILSDNNKSIGYSDMDLFSNFFKILEPNQKFEIIIPNTTKKLTESIFSQVIVLNYNDFSNWKSFINTLSTSTPPSYQSNSIVLYKEYLNGCAKVKNHIPQ